jgi:hypothetical protein
MKTALSWTGLLLIGAALACGSKPPPAPDAPAAAPSAAPANSSASAAAPGSAASASPADSSAPAAGSGTATATTTVDSQREPFMQGCLKRVPSPDYCQCGFEQFRALFKDADMSKETPDSDPRFAQLQQQTLTACASKLPEETVKAGFLSGCTGDEPKKAAYCQCAYPALRKTLALGDFIGDFQGPRFDDAKKTMVKTCKGKFPAAVAQAEFMGACTKNDPSTTGRCACVWKKIKAKYSTEEIAAGMADVGSTPGVETCK